VVNIPSSSRRSDAAAQDDNADGRIDERDASVTETRPAAQQDTDASTYRSASAPPGNPPAAPATPPAPPAGSYGSTVGTGPTAYPPTVAQPAAGTAGVDPNAAPYRAPGEDATVVTGPRPRASLLATLSLIAGVAAALFVLSGALAGYGIGLGVLALLLAFAGISATSRRHVAGKSDALIGLILGLGAIALGILAVTNQLAWPTTDGDTVQRFREWLDAQFVDRF